MTNLTIYEKLHIKLFGLLFGLVRPSLCLSLRAPNSKITRGRKTKLGVNVFNWASVFSVSHSSWHWLRLQNILSFQR